MDVDLSGVQLKLWRADRHIAELREVIKPILHAAEQSVSRQPQVDESEVVYAVGYVPDIDPIASVIVGDVVHNLRSALDHLAWQLVRFDNGTPDEYTQFPLSVLPLNKDGSPRQVTIQPGIRNPAIIAALIEVQPYTSANRGHTPTSDVLWIVHRLDAVDKHRLLLSVTQSINRHEVPRWHGLPGDAPSPMFEVNLNALNSGDVVLKFTFPEGSDPPPDFYATVPLAISLDEGEASWASGIDLIDALTSLRVGVTNEINLWFVPILGCNRLV